MLGAYATLWLSTALHVNPLATLPTTAGLFFVLGIAIERLLVRRLAGAPPISTLLLLFGLCLAMQNFAYSVFTDRDALRARRDSRVGGARRLRRALRR